MMKTEKPLAQCNDDRRRFLQLSLLGVGTAAVLGSLPRMGHAADLPHLTPDDATAKALGYVEDTTKANSAKFPNHTPSQECLNCNFYQGADGAEYGPCTLFPGKAVHSKGWCSAYVVKPA